MKKSQKLTATNHDNAGDTKVDTGQIPLPKYAYSSTIDAPQESQTSYWSQVPKSMTALNSQISLKDPILNVHDRPALTPFHENDLVIISNILGEALKMCPFKYANK